MHVVDVSHFFIDHSVRALFPDLVKRCNFYFNTNYVSFHIVLRMISRVKREDKISGQIKITPFN